MINAHVVGDNLSLNPRAPNHRRRRRAGTRTWRSGPLPLMLDNPDPFPVDNRRGRPPPFHISRSPDAFRTRRSFPLDNPSPHSGRTPRPLPLDGTGADFHVIPLDHSTRWRRDASGSHDLPRLCAHASHTRRSSTWSLDRLNVAGAQDEGPGISAADFFPHEGREPVGLALALADSHIDVLVFADGSAAAFALLVLDAGSPTVGGHCWVGVDG